MKTIAGAVVAIVALASGAAQAATLGPGDVIAAGFGSDGPTTWAMLIAGFGAAGALMRRGRVERTYRLIEEAPGGHVLEEEFAAPDDASAFYRAASVAAGRFQLWRGDVLVGAEVR